MPECKDKARVRVNAWVPRQQIDKLAALVERGDIMSVSDGVRRALTEYTKELECPA
jgi:Arc/MetJ-type ribon-helix-helix transcriptional regulator